jgi:hypothetical protein
MMYPRWQMPEDLHHARLCQHAQAAQDLTALEFEELLKIEVIPVNVVALHPHPKDVGVTQLVFKV